MLTSKQTLPPALKKKMAIQDEKEKNEKEKITANRVC